MQLGIVGLPNVGKSTLFNAITQAGAECANYPFCTIEPNVGVVPVPDERLGEIFRICSPGRAVPATIEFVDIAGLVQGASKGEGLGNQFLGQIREVDAIIHLVRYFQDDRVAHVAGPVDPLRDVDTINTELILADLETLAKRMEKVQRQMKSGEKRFRQELAVLERLTAHLGAGRPARELVFDQQERAVVDTLFLLTMKPVIYVANVDEESLEEMAAHLTLAGEVVLPMCVKLEDEIAQLAEEEKEEFLTEMGLPTTGLERLIKASYHVLGLITFFTVNEKEVRAWPIKDGTKAPQAAGLIHSDFERGFIRADVVSFFDLASCRSYQVARDQGLVRSEGKEYIVRDGDIILFRFHV